MCLRSVRQLDGGLEDKRKGGGEDRTGHEDRGTRGRKDGRIGEEDVRTRTRGLGRQERRTGTNAKEMTL